MKTLDIEECGAFLKIGASTAQRLASEGKIPGAKIGKSWVFLMDDLAQYLREQVQIQQTRRSKPVEAQGRISAPSSKRGRKQKVLPDLSRFDYLLKK